MGLIERIASPRCSSRITKKPGSVAAILLLTSMLVPLHGAMAATCTADASPSGSCTDLVINNPNDTVDVATGVTVLQTGFNASITIHADGLNFSNEGTVDVTTGNVGFYNQANTSSLTNSGTLNAIYNDNGFSIGTVNNSGMLYSNTGIAINNQGTIGTLINSSTITSPGFAVYNGDTMGTLINSGTISSTFGGVAVDNQGTLTTLTNTGNLTSTATDAIYNNATLTNLNNLQGASSTPLTYGGFLPTNYNIIIHSGSDYGQLAATSATGTMNFGVYGGSTVVAGTTYASVLSGVAPGNLSATTGTYGAYNWTLTENGVDIWDLLFSSAVVTPSFSITAMQASADQLAGNMGNSLAQSNVTGLNLLGGTRPITGGTYTYAGGMFGSAEGFVGAQHSVDDVTLLGGISFGHQDYDAVKQSDSVTIALAGRHTFDPVAQSLRPYIEIGGWAIPQETLSLSRSYDNAGTAASGHGDSDAYSLAGYGRAGLIYDLTEQDQLVGYGELGRQALHHDGYSETADASNPFPATVSGGTLRYDVTRWGGLYTHKDTIAGVPVSATFSGALAHSFDAQSDLNVTVAGVGSVQAADDTATWGEYGAQIGVRLTPQLTGSLGVLGTSGDSGMGTQVHGLAGLSYAL